MMRYDDKEYTKEPAPSFRAWDDTCTGCAFHDDDDMCRKSCNKDDPESRCYLCELTDLKCLECPLSGIAWRKDHSCPCVHDKDSVYRRITYLMNDGRYEEAKDAIKEFLSIIDNECRRW